MFFYHLAGDRIFPPQTGLTFSTWVCVEKYSDPRTDPHCVRLLTLVRHVPGRDHHLVCLSVVILAREKALIVSTHETNFPQPGQGKAVFQLYPFLSHNTLKSFSTK